MKVKIPPHPREASVVRSSQANKVNRRPWFTIGKNGKPDQKLNSAQMRRLQRQYKAEATVVKGKQTQDPKKAK